MLADNIALLNQIESVQGTAAVSHFGVNRPRLREVTSLATWCYCFLGYLAITTADPTTRDQLAYARLIIREAQRHGGSGWLEYDRTFRQQAALEPLTRWNTLNPSLLAATVLTQRPQGGQFCTLCRGVDHTRSQCALLCLQPPSVRRLTPTSSPRICTSWNRGTCTFPGECSYLHVCSICPGFVQHKAIQCPKSAQAGKTMPYPPPLLPRPGQGPSGARPT